MFSHKSFLLLIILLLATFARAQEAYQLSEVTRLRCDLGEISQLDNAAQQIIENNKVAFIIYGRKGTSLRYIDYLQLNFLKFRFPDFDFSPFISFRYAGYTEDPKMEIWIIPPRADEPIVKNADIETTARLFDVYGYWYQYCPDERMPALKIFADELKQNPNLIGYVVTYYFNDNSEEIKVSKDAEMMTDIRKGQRTSITDKMLLKKLGVESSRIFTIDVDYNKSSYAYLAKLWIVPQDSIPDIIIINKNQSKN